MLLFQSIILLSDFKENLVDFLKSLSPSTYSNLIIVFIIAILVIVVGIKIKNQDPMKPSKGIVLLFEILINWINGFAEDIIGPKWKKYAPYVLTLAMIIFLSNIAGLFTLHPPTANICITVALGIMTFVVIQATAIKEQGFLKWLHSFLEPSPLMLPMNIIGELVTPFSMGIRLFGNILSGSIITGLLYGALGELWVHISTISIPLGYILTPIVLPIMHAIFDLFFGAIQTYVFILLTMIFISGKMPEES